MNTFKFMNSFPIDVDNFKQSITSLRTKLYDVGICWTDDQHGNVNATTPFRVILYGKKTGADYKNPMTKECNGLVLEYNQGWKVLAIPPRAFCTNKLSFKKINDLYTAGAYDVYEVLDATILTLYFYNAEWKVSSTKGYDIGNMNMTSEMTYMQAIQHLMDTKYCLFKFENLNKAFSYTIALRHSKYHIFDETKHLVNRTRSAPREGVDMNSYIMIMCVSDLCTMSYVAKHVAGLPKQNPLSMRDSGIHVLTNYARSSYAKYEKAYRLQNFKYKPLYGYILRSKNKSVPDECSTIYIESELFKVLQIALYKNNEPLQNNDINQMITNMSINHERYEQFKILFQQFSHKFEELENIINLIAMETISQIVSPSEMGDYDDTKKDLISDLVQQFSTQPDITTGVVKDMIYSKRYVEKIKALLN